MTPTTILRERQPELLAEIRRGRVPMWARSDLVALLQRTLEASQGRAAGATKRSRERSAAIRAGIRRAVGVLPLDQRGVAGVIQRRIARAGPSTYGLARVPGIETIRDVLRAMNEERKSSVSVSKASQRAAHTGYGSPTQATT